MVKRSNVALVVPSIRQDSFARFIREWAPTGLFDRVDLILVEDNPKKTFDLIAMFDSVGPDFDPKTSLSHISWEDIDTNPWSWIIPRRSDTVRSYGYWYAYVCGYEYLMTLDDDCYPQPGFENLDLLHLEMLNGRTKWYNTLNAVTPRGVPYYNLGKRSVHVNHGIWKGILDYDAPHQLVAPEAEVYDESNRIVPGGAYFPFCGMNWMCSREAIPLMYHMLMGQMLPEYKGISAGPSHIKVNTDAFPNVSLDKLAFDRFGDIWCGIVMKKICDHLRWSVSTGTPYIHHDRASSPFTNLRKEANGIEVNEWFWQKVDEIELTSDQPVGCYHEIADSISSFGGEHASYWINLGKAMAVWANLFVDTFVYTPYVPADDDIPF